MQEPEVWLSKNTTTTPLPLVSSNQFDLLGRISTNGSIIDIGCGKNDSPISKQIKLIECDFLCSVDAYDPYLEIIKTEAFLCKNHQLMCLNMLQIPIIFNAYKFDLALCLDSIEHLKKEDGINFLKQLPNIAKNILVWIPIGNDPVKSLDGNIYQEHLSTWQVQDLLNLNFSVQLFKKAHTKSPPVDAAWCYY